MEVVDGPETALHAGSSMNRKEAAAALVSAFRSVGVGRHTVRTARDRFDTIRSRARNGSPQVIGHKSKDMTVVMSLAELFEIIQAAREKQSFGEALDAAGFNPVSTKEISVREGFPAEPLVRWKNKGTAND